jgi:hypothetical protein
MAATESPSLGIAKGRCTVLFAYDVGLSIDLDAAERRITTMKERAAIRHKQRAPRYFDYRPPPVRVTQHGESLDVGSYRSASTVDAVLYDFGAVSVAYTVPLQGNLNDLFVLAEDLYENERLLADSRRRVDELLAAISPVVGRPEIADFVETYAIFEVERFDAPCSPEDLVSRYGSFMAQLLRSERQKLSAEEVGDALTHRISFTSDDLAIIDWDVAFLFGREMEDVRAVLEFANVELLEMRYLDQQLDDALDESYVALSRRSWRRLRLPGTSRKDLHRVAQLQVDAAILFETVNNALKLLGDQYLARVYRQVSQRFHLGEWDASILHKLQTLDSIYQKMSDAAATWRLELLEWAIVILIAVSIILPFIPGMPGH